MEVSKCRKEFNFQKFQLTWKIVKHFMRPKQRAALKKLFRLSLTHSPPDKILLRLWNKNVLMETYRNIQTFNFKVLQECSSRASRNGAVQIIFLTQTRNMFAGKFLKSERLLAVLREYFIFNVKWVEVRKTSEVFWVKPYCKISHLFPSFC